MEHCVFRNMLSVETKLLLGNYLKTFSVTLNLFEFVLPDIYSLKLPDTRISDSVLFF